ncbi:hypothetical protein DLM78_11670 [Leptospira stimsonii]|uniref:Uncharacterized protein n=1 Tax=Leptospira stimsonii TaxID=2202203 RepID=A0A8B6RYM5_9LEPT|nr:hypothetical protein DLM78_11670 [Leptospira stimsonii]
MDSFWFFSKEESNSFVQKMSAGSERFCLNSVDSLLRKMEGEIKVFLCISIQTSKHLDRKNQVRILHRK